MRRNIQAARRSARCRSYPRLRLLGSSFGGYTSIRRGQGSDVAGSRPYQPGDHFHAIDWKASARLSVRARARRVHRPRPYAEEMPRVVIVCDRRPEMALFPPELPWLHKPEAVAWCIRLLAASAINQRALVGYLDYGSHDGSAPGSRSGARPARSRAAGTATSSRRSSGTRRATATHRPTTSRRRFASSACCAGSVTPGSFVFVLSDFLVDLPPTCVGHADRAAAGTSCP